MAHRHTIAGIFVSAMLIVFVSSATVGQTKEAKEDWQGIPVGMFMDIQGQQFSYVAGFMDSAIFMYHQFGVSDLKWLAKCLADHPNTTNPVEIVVAVIGKLNTVLEDHPEIREEPVGLFIWAELEVKCGRVK